MGFLGDEGVPKVRPTELLGVRDVNPDDLALGSRVVGLEGEYVGVVRDVLKLANELVNDGDRTREEARSLRESQILGQPKQA